MTRKRIWMWVAVGSLLLVVAMLWMFVAMVTQSLRQDWEKEQRVLAGLHVRSVSYKPIYSRTLRSILPIEGEMFNRVNTIDLAEDTRNADLIVLRKFAHLRHVYLWNTDVTDAGADDLKPLKKLLTLNLQYTRVSERKMKELETALPSTRLYGGEGSFGMPVLK